MSRRHAKRIIKYHSPVGEQHQRLGEDVPQQSSRRWHVRQNDGRENAANAGAASVSSLVTAKVDRQIAEQMIMRGRQSRQQLLRRGDPRVVIVRVTLCVKHFHRTFIRNVETRVQSCILIFFYRVSTQIL